MDGPVRRLIRQLEEFTASAIASQITDPSDPEFGGIMHPGEYRAEPREGGFVLSRLLIALNLPQCHYYRSEALRETIRGVISYMHICQRPGGLFDLSSCNFLSAPDTAFMCNSLFNAWWLMDKLPPAPEDRWMADEVRAFLISCCEGICRGGFHTPNHRWAIAACLKSAAKAFGRQDFSDTAEIYLAEGLDISENGEFAERSSGNYNQVNDDQMIRLYLATGEKRYLLACRANLEMVYHYFEPDGTVFTGNSTRQDRGRKVYPGSYFILFLLTGYLLKDPSLTGAAAWILRLCEEKQAQVTGLEWFLLFDDLEDCLRQGSFNPSSVTEYNRLFPESGIVRARRGNYSWTLVAGQPNFLYFMHGDLSFYLVACQNVCDKRHFTSDSIRPIEGGYRMTCVQNSWYYLPWTDENRPSTSDWWAMNNPETRTRLQGTPLTTVIDVLDVPNGIDIVFETSGLDRVPFRLEMAVSPCLVRGSQMILDGNAGQSLLWMNGDLELSAGGKDAITVGEGFAAHRNLFRPTGAVPLSGNRFTLMLTDYTPFRRTLKIRTAPFGHQGLR